MFKEIEMIVSEITDKETEEDYRIDLKIKLIVKLEEMTEDFYDFLKQSFTEFKITNTGVQIEIKEMDSKIKILKIQRRFHAKHKE